MGLAAAAIDARVLGILFAPPRLFPFDAEWSRVRARPPCGKSGRYYRSFARVAADETRAKTNGEFGRFRTQDYFLSNIVWTPVVNLCRDSRWGRCQETMGEDTFLTSQLARVQVDALQNGGLDNDKYLETIATCKHFDVHGTPSWSSLLVRRAPVFCVWECARSDSAST